jgi:hypothetical protein
MPTDSYYSTPDHYSVYVVLLSDDVGTRRNAEFPSVYVGQTGLRPEHRYQNHKSGNRSSKYVRNYGIRLMPEIYEQFNPMTYEESMEIEGELADYLEEVGYTVYGGAKS